MTSKSATFKLARELGATIEARRAGSVLTINVMAPRGKHWSARQVHDLVESGRPTSALQQDEMWLDILKAMELGLDDCDLNDPNCADWSLE